MKKFFCAATFALALGAAGAIEVNRGELESAGNSVEFENYGGPHAVIESARAITEIGSALGRLVAANPAEQATYGANAKYSIIHAVSSGEEGKLDADILVLNEKAGVDHIKNLRRIISGFLAAAYGYSEDDAFTIATFVTVYNAVYRGNTKVFAEKYKENVISLFDEKKLGLSKNWNEWAGRTQIVIPLGILNGVSAVDTSVISDENVVNALKETEDKGIEERKKLAEIKQKESENAAQKAADAQKDAAKKKPEAEIAKKDSKDEPENEEKKKKADEAKKEVEKSSKEAEIQQRIADKKKEEARKERDEIKKDERKATNVLQELDRENYVNGLVRTDEKAELYGLVKVDSDSGEIVRSSTIKNIRGQKIYTVNNIAIQGDNEIEKYKMMYIAICGTSGGRSAVKLCLIDALTLEMKKESEEILADGSSLANEGGNYFAVVNIDGEYFIGAFDQNLTLKKRSAAAVRQTTPISVTERGLMATDKSGNPIILNISDLSSIWGEKGKGM